MYLLSHLVCCSIVAYIVPIAIVLKLTKTRIAELDMDAARSSTRVKQPNGPLENHLYLTQSLQMSFEYINRT